MVVEGGGGLKVQAFFQALPPHRRHSTGLDAWLGEHRVASEHDLAHIEQFFGHVELRAWRDEVVLSLDYLADGPR